MPNALSQPSASTTAPNGAVVIAGWQCKHPVAWLLGILVGNFVFSSFEDQSRAGRAIEAILLTLSLLTALLAVGGKNRTLILGVALVLPALIGKWLNHIRPDLVSPPLFLIPGMLFIAFVVAHLFRFMLRARRIDSEVICAGVATYLMLSLLWGFAYLLVARLNPDAFVFGTNLSGHSMTGFTALYFSFVTQSTLGCNDIVAVSGATRMLVMTQSMAGTFYMAVLISRLISLYSPPAPQTGR